MPLQKSLHGADHQLPVKELCTVKKRNTLFSKFLKHKLGCMATGVIKYENQTLAFVFLGNKGDHIKCE